MILLEQYYYAAPNLVRLEGSRRFPPMAAGFGAFFRAFFCLVTSPSNPSLYRLITLQVELLLFTRPLPLLFILILRTMRASYLFQILSSFFRCPKNLFLVKALRYKNKFCWRNRIPIRVRPFRLQNFFAYKRNKANLDPFHMCFTISL